MSPDPTDAVKLPLPTGVIADTGDVHAALSEAEIQRLTGLPRESSVVLARTERGEVLAVEATVDAKNLAEAGWGVLFASDSDPAIKEALRPLLDLRQSQVGNDKLFRVFDGPAGVRPSQPAAAWAANKGVSLVAPVVPRKGVPYYLLIVGSPSRIPFDFQALFDLQWAVGRLHFDTVDGYAAYAQKVVEYETGAAPKRKRSAAVWMPRNKGDLATPMLAGTIGENFLGRDGGGDAPLGQGQRFDLRTFIGQNEATKDRLTAILRGSADSGGPPALLFTGSHGAEWSIDTPDVQRARQGALVTQEWIRGQKLDSLHYFAASDLTADTSVHGLIAFVFACFGGGCPTTDTYFLTPAGIPVALTPEPLIAALPQELLKRGTLAVIAHVDRAFSYGFEDVTGTSQPQVIRGPLELLMMGRRVGMAVDPLNLLWSTVAAQLGLALGGNLPGNPRPSSPTLANLYIARDDAKNYIVLGDPAVALRDECMT